MQCSRCNWFRNEFANCVSYDGNPNAELVFVGEAFGKTEAEFYKINLRRGNPVCFIGDTGKKFSELLRLIPVDRSKVAVMNAMRCYQAGNPTPSRKELDSCFIYSYRDIKNIDPSLVIAMGGPALYQMTGKEGVRAHRGKLIWSDKIGKKVFVTYRPAACLYDAEKWDMLEEDFKKIRSMIDAEPTKIEHYSYTLVNTKKEFREVYYDLIDSDIYLDIEATGLSPYKDTITTLQMAKSPDNIWVIDGSILKEIRDSLEFLFSKNNIIGQGFEFDVKFLNVHLGIMPQKWKFDTCLAEYMLTGMKANDLSFLVSKYVPESSGYDAEVKAAGGAHKVKDRDELLQYAADDVGVLFKIRKNQAKQLFKIGIMDIFEDVMVPTNRILTEMSLLGIKYNVDEIWKVDKIYNDKAIKAWKKIESLPEIENVEKYFKKKFNPGSPLHIRRLILDEYKLPVLKTTKIGNPSIGKEEMKRYAVEKKNPYCIAMEKYRSIQTVRSNFLYGVEPKLINSIAHTTYSSHATSSGRPNSKDPNLLNIPREKDIKRCLVARDGCCFVGGDQGQLEVRVAAVVYNEPRLIKICNDLTRDFHCQITAQAFGLDYNEVYDKYKAGDVAMTELRVKGKSVQFGIIYQETAVGLSYSLNITEKEAQSFIDEYYKRFPDMIANIEKTKRFIINNGYIDNEFGFRRRFIIHEDMNRNLASLREGVNHRVQSTAWYIIALCMIQINNEFIKRKLDAKLIMQVYDSIYSECPLEERDEVADIIKSVMENVIKPYPNLARVKLVTDVEWGFNMADMERI